MTTRASSPLPDDRHLSHQADHMDSAFNLEPLEGRLLLSTTLINFGGDFATTGLEYSRDDNIDFVGDFDGDLLADDQLTGLIFDDASPLSPAIGPDYNGSSVTFYGGANIVGLDDPSQNGFNGFWTKIGGTSSTDRMGFQADGNDAAIRQYAQIIYWDQDSLGVGTGTGFLNGYDNQTIDFSAMSTSELEDVLMYTKIQRLTAPMEGRWVIRDGNQFYLSQSTFVGQDSFTLTGQDLVNELWAPYDPNQARFDFGVGYDLNFDQAGATFATTTASFTDVTAFGLYMENDNGQGWTSTEEFFVDLSITDQLSQQEALVNKQGDVDPNAGVHNGDWYDNSAFEDAYGNTYADGVGFYFQNGQYPALTATYDLSKVFSGNRVLTFDLFADPNIGDFASMSGEKYHIEFIGIDGPNEESVWEANVTLGPSDAPLIEGIELDLGNFDDLRIEISTDVYSPTSTLHGGLVLGNAEFIPAITTDRDDLITQPAASPITGSGTSIGLSFYSYPRYDAYEIQRSTDSGETWALLDTPTDSAVTIFNADDRKFYIDNTVVDGNRYWYRVRGVDDPGLPEEAFGPYSTVVAATASSGSNLTDTNPVAIWDKDDPSPISGSYTNQWADGSTFEAQDGTTYASGLGIYFGTGYAHPNHALTYFTPESGNQVLNFDAFLDVNQGDFNDTTSRIIRLKVWGNYFADGRLDGKIGNRGDQGPTTELLYEGKLSLGAGQAPRIEDVFVNLAGYETFSIVIEEDFYDGTNSYGAVVLGDAQFVAAMPVDFRAPVQARATVYAGHDDQLQLWWDDRNDEDGEPTFDGFDAVDEDGFKIERSTDGLTWTQIATTGSDVNQFLDTGLTPGQTYHYRVRSFGSSGDSHYSNIASATTSSSRELQDQTFIEDQFSVVTPPGLFDEHFKRDDLTNFKENPNPAVGTYANQWWDGTTFEDSLGNTYTNGLGFAAGTNPFRDNRITFVVPDDQDIFRFDAFVDANKTPAGAKDLKLNVYGDFGTANQTLLTTLNLRINETTLPVSLDNFISTDGYQTITFEQSYNTNLGFSTKVEPIVLANAGFVDSYPPGPIPPTQLKLSLIPVRTFELEWVDNSTDEDGFEIQFSESNPGGVFNWMPFDTVGPDVTSFNATDLPAGYTMYFRVRAFNSEGNSPWTNIVSGTTNEYDENLDIQSSQYVGGSGDDAAGGVDLQSDGEVIYGGLLPNSYSPGSVTPVDLLGGGDGAIIRYNATGTQVMSVTRLPGAVLDVRVGGDDRIAVAVEGYGAVILNADASSVMWSVAEPMINRIDIGSNNYVAFTADQGNFLNTIYSYDDQGNSRGSRVTGDAFIKDVAYDPANDYIITTGLNNRHTGQEPINVAYIDAYEAGNMANLVWNNYDWPGPTFRDPLGQDGEISDSFGFLVTIGDDGQLYFAGESAGGASTFLYDPQIVDLKLPLGQLVAYDEYSQAYNTASNQITWVGRYDPSDGSIDKGQFVLTRLGSGAGNSHFARSLDADAQGNVYVGGKAFYAMENRFGKQINNTPIAGYMGGEAYILKLSSNFFNREIWTPFTMGTNSTNSEIVGIGVNGDHVAIVGNIENDLGELFTTGNGAQNIRGDLEESWLAVWGADVSLIPPKVTATDRSPDSTVRPDQLHTYEVTFDKDVSASLDAGDLSIFNDTTGLPVDTNAMTVSWNSTTMTATFDLTALSLTPDDYTFTLAASGISDVDANPLDGNGDDTGGDDFVESLYVAIPGDANLDKSVNIGDLTLLAGNFGTVNNNWGNGDFNDDGQVNIGDLTILASNFGTSVTAPAFVTTETATSTSYDTSTNELALAAWYAQSNQSLDSENLLGLWEEDGVAEPAEESLV